MKKFISVIMIAITSFAVCGCDESFFELAENSEITTEAEASLASTDIGVKKADNISIDNAYSIYSGGRNFVVVEINYSNKSDTAKSFYDEYNIVAYQNGVEVYQNNSWQCTQFDLKACAAHVQPGFYTKVYMAFEAADLTANIDVVCTSLSSTAEIKASLSINSKYYVSQKQIDDKKKADEAAKLNQQGIMVMKEFVTSIGLPYCVYDFDKDGNSDIVVDRGNNEYSIYIYEDGVFYNVGALDGTIYKSKKNGCYTYTYNYSYETFEKYEYRGGRLERNEKEEISRDFEEPIYYYVDQKKVSKKEYDSNFNIIMSNEMKFSECNNTSPIQNAKFVN